METVITVEPPKYGSEREGENDSERVFTRGLPLVARGESDTG